MVVPLPMVTPNHLEAYLHHLADDLRRASSTISGYEAELRLLLARQVPMEPEQIAAFVTRSTQGELLAPTTRNRRLAIVRGFTRYLVAQGVLPADPTACIARAKVPSTRKVALSVDELSRVVAVVLRSPRGELRARDLALLFLLFYTGLRVSELQRIQVDQIDLDAGLLRRATRKGGGTTDVVLHPCAAEAVRAWLLVRPATGSALFPRGNGRLTVRAVQKRLRMLGEAAGLGSRLHPHALRHAHATALLRCGISTELIRQSLNHASLQTTQRYLHGDLGMVRSAIGQLPDLLPR